SSEFETAIQSYQYAVDHFPESDSAEPAAEAIPPTYFEWAQSLFDEGDLQATLDMYDLIIETYPDSESAEQALAARATAYLGLAKQLLDEGSFNDSIDTYLTVQELTEDEEMLAQIEAGLADAIMGLAMDTGSEGQALINSTLIQVCDRTPATSPAVNILPEERGKFLACSNSPSGFFVSDDLSPQFPGEFRYALEVSVSTADLNSGRYGSRGDIILVRQRVDWTVHIIDVATGKIVTSKTFTGGTPPDFPRSHHFDSNPDYLQGPPPSMEDILNWLYSIF
ncbi:MAG: hypothetical protein OEV06_09875, partial [Anaerolineae bacterium]|nr:hypothetical protein [Anaerolineae bacterium]